MEELRLILPCHFYDVDANSSEINPNTEHPIVINMPEISTTQLGGTMRLGDRVTIFQPKTESSTIRKLYGGVNEVHERHRHRYEVNPAYVARLEKAGLQFIGRDEKGERMIIFELKGTFSVCLLVIRFMRTD